jgi:hypothetical protein
MFIGQGGSIVGVYVVYVINSLVHPSNCLYKPLNQEEQKRDRRRERKRRIFERYTQ